MFFGKIKVLMTLPTPSMLQNSNENIIFFQGNIEIFAGRNIIIEEVKGKGGSSQKLSKKLTCQKYGVNEKENKQFSNVTLIFDNK